MNVLGYATSPREIVALLEKRRYALGIKQLDLDAVAGLADGHCGKIACGTKPIGHISLPNLLAALGLKLAVIADDTALPRQTRALIGSSRGKPRCATIPAPAAIPAPAPSQPIPDALDLAA
jgi:hypothetical protein